MPSRQQIDRLIIIEAVVIRFETGRLGEQTFVVVPRPRLTKRDLLHTGKIFGINFGDWMSVEKSPGNSQFFFESCAPFRCDGVTSASPLPGKIDMVIGFNHWQHARSRLGLFPSREDLFD